MWGKPKPGLQESQDRAFAEAANGEFINQEINKNINAPETPIIPEKINLSDFVRENYLLDSKNPERNAYLLELSKRLKQALADTSIIEGYQALVIQKLYFEGKSLSEISTELGISQESVMNYKSYALRALKESKYFKDLKPKKMGMENLRI